MIRSPGPLIALALFGLGALSAGGADFSGRWTLTGQASDKLRDRGNDAPAPGVAGQGGGRRGRGPGGASGGGRGTSAPEGMDLPLEALGDAHLLDITDDGSTLRVSYSSGRKRILFGDGDERELDDGDGPAKVTSRRKGDAGEKILVASKWSGSGRSLTETWELLGSPRRLTVTGKASGRQTYKYQRVYEPAPPEPTPAPTPPAVRATATAPDTASAPPAAGAAPAGMSACSIRPPRGTSQAELAHMAKISSDDAARRAVASVAPLKVSSVISSDVEVDEGCLVWTFDLRLPEKKGVQEVFVDAGDGKVLSSRFEEAQGH